MVHRSGIIWSITSGKHANTNVFILILYLRKSNTQHCVMLHPSSLKMGPLPVSLRCQKLVRLPTLNLVSFSSVFQLLSVAASRAQPVATWKCRHARSSQRCRKQIHESISVSFIYGCIMYFTRFQLSFQRKFVSQRPHKQNYLVLMIIRLWFFITIFCRKIIFYKDKSERWSLMILMCWNNDQHDP